MFTHREKNEGGIGEQKVLVPKNMMEEDMEEEAIMNNIFLQQ